MSKPRGSIGSTLIVGAFVLASCGDDAHSSPDLIPTGACRESLDCTSPCQSAEHCDPLGGYACVPLASTDGGTQLDASMMPIDVEDSGSDDEDAAIPMSVAPTRMGARSVNRTRSDFLTSEDHESARGERRMFCARTCDSRLCREPGHVCSSRTGFCRPGCDETQTVCESSKVCDRTLKRCVSQDGECESEIDCGIFDGRLLERGRRECSMQRCRFIPGTKSNVDIIESSRSSALEVEQPAKDQRIEAAAVDGFVFRFATPGQTIIATILTRPHRSVRDAAKAAVWAAFVPSDEAADGIGLARGGRMRNGEWSEAQAELIPDTRYYFLVLAMARGEVVAESDLIPFTIGQAYARAGDSCFEDDAFCASDEVLICAQGICRTPCLSDLDCEGLSCGPPGWRGVRARLCL